MWFIDSWICLPSPVIYITPPRAHNTVRTAKICLHKGRDFLPPENTDSGMAKDNGKPQCLVMTEQLVLNFKPAGLSKE